MLMVRLEKDFKVVNPANTHELNLSFSELWSG